MRYGITFEEGEEPTERISLPSLTRKLPRGVSYDSISQACRGAAMAFMSGVAEGFTKFDLAMWLSGPYAHATRFVPRGERAPAPSNNDASGLEPDRLEELMQNARMHALALCEELALPRSESDFIDDAIGRGLLTAVEDEVGSTLWAPVDGRRMRLRDRVRSLFVVDYLVAPAAYETELFVCHRCEQIVFDERAKRTGQCSLHRRRSGIVPRGDVSIDATERDEQRDESDVAESTPKGDATFGQAG